MDGGDCKKTAEATSQDQRERHRSRLGKRRAEIWGRQDGARPPHVAVMPWRWNSTSPASCGRSTPLVLWQRQRAGTSRSTSRPRSSGSFRMLLSVTGTPTSNQDGSSPSAI